MFVSYYTLFDIHNFFGAEANKKHTPRVNAADTYRVVMITTCLGQTFAGINSWLGLKKDVSQLGTKTFVLLTIVVRCCGIGSYSEDLGTHLYRQVSHRG